MFATGGTGDVAAQDLRGRPALDDVDRRIVEVLQVDGRIPNNALAERVGVAASTCLARVRDLRARGVVRGIHADVDPTWLGRPIQAMISVRLQSHARASITQFSHAIAHHPDVLNVFFLAGSYDFVLHVAVSSTDDLRYFVADHLSTRPEVAGTETNLIFEHVRADVRTA